MIKRFAPTSSLLFVAATLLTVIAIFAPLVMLRFNTITRHAEDDAATNASRIIGPRLSGEASNLGNAELASFVEEANALLGGHVRAIRLFDSDGELLATAGAAGAEANVRRLFQAANGELATAKAVGPEGDLLVSYTLLQPGVVLEIQQDYGPVAASVASSRRDLLMVAGAGVLALTVLLTIIHWLAVRGLRGEYTRLRSLYLAGQAIRSTLDLTDVLEHLVRDTALYTRARLGLVTLVEEESDELILKASFRRKENISANHHRHVEAWFLRRCVATGETVVSEAERSPDASFLGLEQAPQRPVVMVSVPIMGRQGAIGVVTAVRDSTDGPFQASEVRMMEEMAAQGALAVQQSRLFTKVRRYADEVELSYDNTLKVLMAALETKDATTQGHSERVSRLTVAVAKEMGIPDDRLVDIERGALLHDIGKIGVPDEVLKKPASLDDQEWEAMRKHPLLAGLMISKVEFLEGVLPILLYHHERYDGEGYPFGMERETIPLEARIFTVVDSYDAMTSDRPYREAMTPAAAVREIQRNAGTQFDPRVVEAFTRVISRLEPALKKAS